ncbi:hypothetical protein BKE38_02565 [Pseudoroseomonas deserti]|uniref:Peptidase M10 serralysin C-terminal domain-containing protein n=1 Tax=Teichococcus deserti TaxID=1817963 RepID=A0A1V2H7F4_9PROT|nr:hypothetical protein [Pseudoroseomonas deserti]ONG58681.1 hypothetical protein BKE38_02565 [Pseudoroseomonas deserti]
MTIYNGSGGNDIFLLAHHRQGDAIKADGNATGGQPSGFPIDFAKRGNDSISGGWGRGVVYGGAGDGVIRGDGQSLPWGSPSSAGLGICNDGADLLDGGAMGHLWADRAPTPSCSAI